MGSKRGPRPTPAGDLEEILIARILKPGDVKGWETFRTLDQDRNAELKRGEVPASTRVELAQIAASV